ncbi:MAG: hypothetical protein OEW75_06500 [Cyclobacteriaceae bacterium]|nr:hypothetical protein [Cyclobacteriaceae bacterium]
MTWKIKVIGLLLSATMGLKNLFVGTRELGFDKGNKIFKIEHISNLEPGFFESSGLERADGITFYTHTDSDGMPYLYRFNTEGDFLDTLKLNALNNVDWEDIAQDEDGNFYIGDFGNNLNKRKHLQIYVLGRSTIDSIQFNYESQKDFFLKKGGPNYDCEAMFWFQNSLYLFSKNKKDQWVKAYRISDQPGNYELQPLDSVYLPHRITAADIDVESGHFMLLGYGMVYTFKMSDENIFSEPGYAIKLSKGGQAEALVMTDSTTALITNEKGKIFKLTQKK